MRAYNLKNGKVIISERKIRISDFTFKLAGYGQYDVTFRSENTHKQWMAHCVDMRLIDATKNADEPKIKDLNDLKYFCKNN